MEAPRKLIIAKLCTICTHIPLKFEMFLSQVGLLLLLSHRFCRMRTSTEDLSQQLEGGSHYLQGLQEPRRFIWNVEGRWFDEWVKKLFAFIFYLYFVLYQIFGILAFVYIINNFASSLARLYNFYYFLDIKNS